MTIFAVTRLRRPRATLLCTLMTAGCIIPLSVGDGREASSSGEDPSTSTSMVSATEGGSAPSSTEPGDDSMVGESSGTSALGDDTTGPCVDVCLIDFPCVPGQRGCVDAVTIETFETVAVDDCSQVRNPCPTACICTGSQCEPREPEPCPADHWCVEAIDLLPYNADCLPSDEVCGGPEGLACETDELCEFAELLCPACVDEPEGCGVDSPLGRCVPRPAPEDECGPARPDDEQCGCDGVTYANECERLKAGIPLDRDEPCS